MITKEKALEKAKYRCELHYGPCTKTIGPRGGEYLNIETWRVSGQVKTWKRQPEKFSFPIKYGMYKNHVVDNYFFCNAEDFHFADECPLLNHE
jgi:hypothetical protein